MYLINCEEYWVNCESFGGALYWVNFKDFKGAISVEVDKFKAFIEGVVQECLILGKFWVIERDFILWKLWII